MSLEGAARVTDADITKSTRAVGRLWKGPVAGAFRSKDHDVLRRVAGSAGLGPAKRLTTESRRWAGFRSRYL